MSGDITDAAIVNQLGIRLTKGMIHTSISEVLIICNPYQVLPIYGPSHIALYQTANMSETQPHIFGLAERAYRKMVTTRIPQAVIISGESGAGKTESAKLILHYASSVSGSSPVAQKVKAIILESNPLLEAFGNAKTTRNNNSSRFGKYLSLEFNDRGEPCGGVTTNFLLEKTRVTFQQQSERNFHIFYQLLQGGWPELLQACRMGPMQNYAYLAKSGTFDVQGVDDARNFREVTQACSTMKMSPNDQWYLFSTLCGILHLGNLRLVGRDAPAQVAPGTEEGLNLAAYLFGVDPGALGNSITHKTVAMGGRRNSVVKIPQNADQATQIRDALAKEMYSRLFDFVIAKVNAAMAMGGAGQAVSTFNLLDIYGFEIFQNNVFEQLCINFVNERIQQIFLDAVVKGEQQLYMQEGLQWKPIPFFDNQAICELIEGSRPPGIFRVLDDTCRALHAVDSNTADMKFLERLQSSGLTQNQYLRLKPGTANFSAGFTIQHFAGLVEYDVSEMAFKNMDNLFGSLVDCMKVSQNPFVRTLWPDEDRINHMPTTSSTKIRQSANALMEALRRCETHYVRCIKSNDYKAPMQIDFQRVEQQVTYQGLRENVKVKKAGYSYRAPYNVFLQNFSMLAARSELGRQLGGGVTGAQQLCQFISRQWGELVPISEWAFGSSMIFVHSPTTIFVLQELLEEARDPKAYADKVRAHEQAELMAAKQEAKIQKGKVKGSGKGAGGCIVS